MATLVGKNLSGGNPRSPLFSGLDITIAPGDIIGLVGANGAGKTTLLRLLAGTDSPLVGTVTAAPSDAFVGWMPQEHERTVGETVAGYIERRTGAGPALAAMEAAADALAREEKGADATYATALDHWLASGAPDLADRMPSTLADVAPGVNASALTSALSGGQMARVALAALLLSRFDIVLLDEPTNDLDLEGLGRLEEFLRGLRGGVALVSHDREFLARLTSSILELDLAQGTVRHYNGDYDSYVTERETVRRHAREAYEKFDDTKSDLVARARRQREWSSQGVRNAMKKAPDNDKIRRRANSESSEKQAQKVRQMESRIARLDDVEEPRKEWQLQFSIGAAPRSSGVVATLSGACVTRGEFSFGPVSLQVTAGARIGITGPNGAGKSTLLQLLFGRLTPDTGTASLGANIAIGEVDQARESLDVASTLLAAFETAVPALDTVAARTLLAKFGLGADHVIRPMHTLSPGERTRAALAVLQAKGVNVLVLDEPTNHLDVPAIEQLEQALSAYTGALLLVTHDRRMLENVALDEVWEVHDGMVTPRAA